MPDCRVGQGYDIHRLTPGRRLRLGGVTIDSPLGCEAHSDGDVLLHALIDALLGACALGDIGDHFPPSDARYRDIDSTTLLAETLTLLRRQGLHRLVNVDATVFLEQPKLYPYKETIRGTLATLLELSPDRVSFKAKTAEGFPPVGTREAVAAAVTILLEVNPERATSWTKKAES